MTCRRSRLHERLASLQSVNSAVAALFTVTAVPLIDRALPAAETRVRVGPGTWVALALGIYPVLALVVLVGAMLPSVIIWRLLVLRMRTYACRWASTRHAYSAGRNIPPNTTTSFAPYWVSWTCV